MRIALLHKLDESGSVIALQSMLRSLADAEAEVAQYKGEKIAIERRYLFGLLSQL